MRWAFVAVIALLVGGSLILVRPRLDAGPVGANPPGNNGTIKVDGQPFDDAPDNEPHVGCIFQIDFYGYDQGDLFASVLFAAVPPTGGGQTLLTDTVFIGEDDNSGGGSTAGLDASQTYDLSASLASLTPQPQQGYHLKLTINADGSQGAATKFKVFWVAPCVPVPTESPPIIPPCPSPTPTLESPGPTLPSTDTEDSAPADTEFNIFAVGPCIPPGPPPIVPESPFPILLPLSAAGLAVIALVLMRRRERRARAPTSEGRADY